MEWNQQIQADSFAVQTLLAKKRSFWYSVIGDFFRLTPEVWLCEDKINKKYPATNLQTAQETANNGGRILQILIPIV